MNTQNQKGFSLIEGLLVVIVLLLVGFAGYTVWNNSQDKDASRMSEQQDLTVDSKDSSNKSDTEEKQAGFIVPGDWRTVTENGLTVSYPSKWDSADPWDGDVKVEGLVSNEDKAIGVGFGAPLGYRHVEGDVWDYISVNDGAYIKDHKTTIASTNVAGATSTIIIDGGDGLCRGRKIGIASKGKLYAVSLPWYCNDPDEGQSETNPQGVSPQDVEKDLDSIIRSIIIE